MYVVGEPLGSDGEGAEGQTRQPLGSSLAEPHSSFGLVIDRIDCAHNDSRLSFGEFLVFCRKACQGLSLSPFVRMQPLERHVEVVLCV